MTPSPGHPIDFPTLLQATADIPGSPAIDDYGVPLAAVHRHGAHMLNQDVYWGAHLKAAAVLDTLLRHPWLEHSQADAAWAATRAVLTINGLTLARDVKGSEVLALMRDIAGPGIPLRDIARALRAWTTEGTADGTAEGAAEGPADGTSGGAADGTAPG
ncbi:fic family toxin-antitoxin system, toxin component [Streptomyces sparsogenes]|uniref:fic family toxin-antitoxin system, toxin component n=1 Tax=Streptomyces sparsogenes TaxID=67365 RepID=UPI0033E43880